MSDVPDDSSSGDDEFEQNTPNPLPKRIRNKYLKLISAGGLNDVRTIFDSEFGMLRVSRGDYESTSQYGLGVGRVRYRLEMNGCAAKTALPPFRCNKNQANRWPWRRDRALQRCRSPLADASSPSTFSKSNRAAKVCISQSPVKRVPWHSRGASGAAPYPPRPARGSGVAPGTGTGRLRPGSPRGRRC